MTCIPTSIAYAAGTFSVLGVVFFIALIVSIARDWIDCRSGQE